METCKVNELVFFPRVVHRNLRAVPAFKTSALNNELSKQYPSALVAKIFGNTMCRSYLQYIQKLFFCSFDSTQKGNTCKHHHMYFHT